MAYEATAEAEAAADAAAAAADDMELEKTPTVPNVDDHSASEPVNGDSNLKREREDLQEEAEEENCIVPKKQKAEKSVEEERLEKLDVTEGGNEAEEAEEEKEEAEKSGPVSLGPKSFGSSVEMFDYFYSFLHHWPPSVNINKYEHMVLLDLIRKGHLEPDKKIGLGIHAFQIRYHPTWKSRCFFLMRTDESVDDFSFRKCVDHILPLPDHMKAKSDVNKALGGGGRGHGNKGRGGRDSGRGRGRGGRGRGRGRR